MKKVVLYMRYSSDKQTEQSIEGQERVCREFCKREGYKIVNTYIDRATSAYKDTEKRIAFQKMIKDAEKEQFEGVVVYKLDRFSRNRYDSAIYKVKLKKHGVKVISATENISDNPEGVILESVLEGMAEFYSKELSQKILRGLYETATKCRSIGGCTPFGYKIVDRKYEIDEETAPLVKCAFQMFADGFTIKDIADLFNREGYKTSKGAEFNKSTFRKMFRSEKYLGVYRYKDLVHIDGGMPALIDQETFDRVQERLALNKKLGPREQRSKDYYMLSGKLYCGKCGAPMNAETGTAKSGKKYKYYKCLNNKYTHTCNEKAVRKDELENIVFQNIFEFLTFERLDKIADMAVKASEQHAIDTSPIPMYKKQLRATIKGIDNIVNAIANGTASPTLHAKLAQLEQDKKDIEQQIENAPKNVRILEKEQVVFWLTKFVHGHIDNIHFKKLLMANLVARVNVYRKDDKSVEVEIVYNMDKDFTKKDEKEFTSSVKLICKPPLNSAAVL